MKVAFLWAGQQILLTLFYLCAKKNIFGNTKQTHTIVFEYTKNSLSAEMLIGSEFILLGIYFIVQKGHKERPNQDYFLDPSKRYLDKCNLSTYLRAIQ